MPYDFVAAACARPLCRRPLTLAAWPPSRKPIMMIYDETQSARAKARPRRPIRRPPSSVRPLPAATRAASAATWSPRRCARSTSPISRSIRARAIAACMTRSSTISATSGRRCCCACTRKPRSRSRMATRKSPAARWRAAVHSNVGLMHATMAIFNAWCDRMPVIVLGATGPVDAAHRRPWIDWIHTARDQGALVRGYTKWDDQPASPAAAREAVLRAAWIANTRRAVRSTSISTPACRKRNLPEPLPPIETGALHSAGAERRARRVDRAGGGHAERARSSRSSSPAASRAASRAGTRASRLPKSSMRASSPI